MFTVWTLSARFALGVKSNDSRRGVADAACISGARLNAGVNPGGEREAAFWSVARRIPRRLRPRKSFEPVERAGPLRDKARRDAGGHHASRAGDPPGTGDHGVDARPRPARLYIAYNRGRVSHTPKRRPCRDRCPR